MKYFIVSLLLTGVNTIIAQSLQSEQAKIEVAANNLKSASISFQECLVSNDVADCINTLKNAANTEYEKYAVAGILYDIDPVSSLEFHKQAYSYNTNCLNFNVEYALELHRAGKYAEAIPLYVNILKNTPKDYRINAWLADCYINTNAFNKAVESWMNLSFPQNHTGIDFAIHTIYAKINQLYIRSSLRKEILNGNNKAFYPLFFLDLNWEYDWWNTGIQEVLLQEDIKLLNNINNISDSDKNILLTYVQIKKLKEDEKDSANKIKQLLIANKMIINNGQIPQNGKITSDILRICFVDQTLNEVDFYKERGNEVLNLAKEEKDAEMLNTYAYLQATVDGFVNSEIDKLGWQEFKDERFCISYFTGLGEKNRFDNPDLNKALIDFPDSAGLYLIKARCAKYENKPVTAILIELIKREFKTLATHDTHYSYNLNNYFLLLSEEMK